MSLTSSLMPRTLLLLFLILPCLSASAQPIFDGKSLQGWTRDDGSPITRGWEVVDGMIHLDVSSGRGGNIVTEVEYQNFDLSFEWKIASGGNNGIKYRVRKYGNRLLGLEYQLIDDDGYRHPLTAKHRTASLYDLYGTSETAKPRPIGEFNQSRIVVRGPYLEHWLNGELAVAACAGSPSWYEQKGLSKFSDLEGFGENYSGKIMLTDHNSEVWYRNLQLTPLPSDGEATTFAQRRRGPLRRLVSRMRRR